MQQGVDSVKHGSRHISTSSRLLVTTWGVEICCDATYLDDLRRLQKERSKAVG